MRDSDPSVTICAFCLNSVIACTGGVPGFCYDCENYLDEVLQ